MGYESGMETIREPIFRVAMLVAQRLAEAYVALFDPDHMETEMRRDLPSGLRLLADAIEMGRMTGNVMSFVPAGGRDDQIHIRVSLALAAPVFQKVKP